LSLWSRIFGNEARKSDLEAELRSHLVMAIEDRIAQGESPEEARAAAHREFGNLALVEDVTRETWGWLWFDSLMNDLRYALRQMRRSPGFAFAAIGTLALGIAAAAAMFTVVDHVLLRPLPYRDPGRLAVIQEAGSKSQRASGAPWLDIQQWIAQSRSFEQIAFYGSMNGRNFIEGNSASLQIDGVTVSPNFFATLGVEPVLGRTFLAVPVGFTAGKNAGAVILSDSAWKEAYGGDPAVLGRSIQINRESFTVIGVMPPGFEIGAQGSSPQVWTPLVLADRDGMRNDWSINYSVIGRLRRGVGIQSATAEMSTIQKRIAPEYTDLQVRQDHSDAAVISYAESLVAAGLRKALLALLAASGVLWLIASVNVTNLLMARGMARQREIAMRGALGASRSRILQQFIVESLILSGAATLLGAGLALAAVRLFRSVKPTRLNVDLSAHVNFTILGVLCGLTLLTAVMSSAWPVFLAVRAPIEPALKQGGPRSGAGSRHNRTRSLLVAAEVAMSLTLLVSCGLLLRTIYALRHVSLGYRTDHIVVASLAIPSYRFAGGNMVVDLYQPLLDRVQHLHGVQAAGFISEVPLGQSFKIQLSLNMGGKSINALLKPVSPTIQSIFGFKMLAGRFFNEQDTATSQPVVVVNKAFARLYSPNIHDPTAIVGQQFMNMAKNAPTRIIGVLDDERQASIAEPSEPEVEVCLQQLAPGTSFYQPSTIAMDLALRTDRMPASIIPDLRSILRQASPEMANATFTTMDQVVEDSFGSQRLAAHLLELFGASALLLAVAGLYGLLAWVVTQRTRELGVRIALGAPRSNLLWLVLRQAGAMLLAGAAVGTGLALLAGRLIRGYLYGVGAYDGWTFAGATALLLLSGMVAAYLPARRAAAVDPMVALRSE
jgi:predicted permease